MIACFLIYLNDFKNIGFNILGGVAVIVLERLFFYFRKKYNHFKIKRLFGPDVENDYKLIYGQFYLQEVFDLHGHQLIYPYRKIGATTLHSILDPVSFSDTKAAKYISTLIAKETGKYSELISDQELGNISDISYCSTGGYSNLKSKDILFSKNNSFFNFYVDNISIPGIIDIETNEIIGNLDSEYDLGIIIKIHSQYFPKRIQICIAGLNIWGTSGAAWILANKWKEIYKIVGNKEFGLVIKVRKGNDQESEIINHKVK